MKPATIIKFLKALGCHDAAESGDWVTCKCPLAPFRHKSGKDSTPSFGVNVSSGMFNCFACEKGSLESLLSTIDFSTRKEPFDQLRPKYDFQAARDALDTAESEIDGLAPYEELGPVGTPFHAFPEWWLNSFTPAHLTPNGSAYLHGRHISYEESVREDLRYDPYFDMVVFPYRNAWGVLAGARGRCADPEKDLQHYDYKFNKLNNSGSVFMGEHLIPAAVDNHKPLLVVEGQIDRIACLRHYPYVLANLTAKPTHEKLATLNSCPDGVVLMLDNDETGKEATPLWVKGLKVPVAVLSYPEEFKDPDKVPSALLGPLLSDLLNA